MKWWVAKSDRKPIGPISTELLLERIFAGEVSWDALVCEVGRAAWQLLADTAPFSAAVETHRARRRLESGDDLEPPHDAFPYEFDDAPEHPTAELAPLRPSEPPPRTWAERFDDTEEPTVVDVLPIRKSEPPTEP